MADVRLTATNPEDSSVVPVACDAAGRLLLEEPVQGPPGQQGPPGEQGPPGQDGQDGDPFSGNFAGDVTFGGSAEFAGTVTAKSFVVSGGNGGGPGDAGDLHVTGDLQVDGSSVLAGDVGIGTTAPEATLHTNGEFRVSHPGAVSKGLRVQMENYAGRIGVGATIENLGGTGFEYLRYVDQSTERARIDQFGNLLFGGTSPSDPNISLNADGSVDFAGGKAGFTKEGYLWCTTRRGDTVILDATSNGLASWVEYTPTTRLEEIRDKLDANRGDTGEMPADTQ